MNNSSITLSVEDPEQLQHNLTRVDIKKEWINSPEIYNNDDDTVPNGGYGWVVSFSGFLVCFTLYGTASIWGVFSHAYSMTILKDKATTSELMIVGGIYVISLGLFSPLSPALIHFGARSVMLLGTILASLGLILASFSSESWHLWLTQGVIFGAGVSLVYITSISVIAQWFTKRRGVAMGISSAGTGIGGLSLSPLADYLIHKYGIDWAYRIMGLLSFGVCLIAICLVKTRSSLQGSKEVQRSSLNFSILKNFNFIIWLFGSVISLTGYYIPLYYLPKYSAAHNISNTKSAIVVGISCASNALGRLCLGYLADYIGRLNTYIISSILAGAFCMLLWPFAKTFEMIIAFSLLFGFTSGQFFSLAPPITATVVGQENISSGFSIVFIASAISGVGPPIASAIQKVCPGDGYIGVQLFTGSLYLVGSLICIILKVKLSRSLLSVL